MPSKSADALLFDLGRVVIDIDFNRAFSRWAGHAHCDEMLIRERFRHDTAYKRHERGEIDSEEFFADLRESLGIDISDAQLLEGWNSILVGEMPGVSELLAKAAERASHCMLLPTPIANTSSTGQGSFQAFLAISKRSTCRQRLG